MIDYLTLVISGACLVVAGENITYSDDRVGILLMIVTAIGVILFTLGTVRALMEVLGI